MKIEHTLVGGEPAITFVKAEKYTLYKLVDKTAEIYPGRTPIVTYSVNGWVGLDGFLWNTDRLARRLPAGTKITLIQE